MKRFAFLLLFLYATVFAWGQKEYKQLVRFNIPIGTTEANAKNIIRNNNYSASSTNDKDGIHYVSYRDNERGIVSNYYVTIGIKNGKVESVRWLLQSDSYDRIVSERSALFTYFQEDLNYKSFTSNQSDYYTNFNYFGQKVGAVLYGQASSWDGGFVGITFYSNATVLNIIKEIRKKQKYDFLISEAWNLRHEKMYAEAKAKYDEAFELYPEKKSLYDTEYGQCVSEMEKIELAIRQQREREERTLQERREMEERALQERREMEESAKRQRQEEESRQQARIQQIEQRSREMEQAFATEYAELNRKNDEEQNIPDRDPSFPGGNENLNLFLSENLQYPAVAIDAGISGVVVVSFIVEKDGSITDVKCVRNIGGGCGNEAVRIVKAMPKWIPGVQDGKLVRCQYKLPITFALQ